MIGGFGEEHLTFRARRRRTGDSTVLTIGRVVDGACEIVRVEAWQGARYESVLSAVTAAARRWRLARLICDGTGLGAPLAASLKKSLGPVVEPLAFGAKTKSDLGFDLIAAASTGDLRIAPALGAYPQFSELWDQLRICVSDHERGGQLTWAAPAGAHDDYVVSLALCMRAARTAGAPRVAVGRSR